MPRSVTATMGHDLKRSAFISPGEVIHDARVCFLTRSIQGKRTKHDDAIVARNGQLIAQHRVDHTQDGGVGADPQREGRERDDGETRVAPQHARAVDDVLPEIVQPRNLARVAALFFEEGNVADGAPGSERRVALGHAALDVLPRQLLDVKRQFSGEFIVNSVALEQRDRKSVV